MKFLFITDVTSGTEQQIPGIFLLNNSIFLDDFKFNFFNYFNQITPLFLCFIYDLTVKSLRF